MCRIALLPDHEVSAILHKKLRPAQQWGETYVPPCTRFFRTGGYYSTVSWCDENDTIIITNSCHAQRHYAERWLCFTLYNVGQSTFECAIYGKTDAAIAETATWFWTIRHSGKGDAVLEINASGIDNDLNFDCMERFTTRNSWQRFWIEQSGTALLLANRNVDGLAICPSRHNIVSFAID